MKILIVEDNKDVAEAMTLLLRPTRHEVAVAHDGRGALESCRRWKPDLMMLDLKLTDVSGHDVMRSLAAEKIRPAHVWAVTGASDETAKSQIAQSGFDEHIVKPVDFGRLLTMVRALAQPRATSG